MTKKNRALALCVLSVPLVASAASGTLIYSTYVGGSGTTAVNAVAVDTSGNVTAAGAVGAGGFLAGVAPNGSTSGSFSGLISSPGGSTILTAVALDSSGNTVFAGYTGSSSFVQRSGSSPLHVNIAGTVTALAIDAQNNMYVTGYAFSGLQTTPGVVQTANHGGYDAFVVKLSTVGAVVYATYLGGSSDDFGGAIAVDSQGDAYVAGSTASPDFPLRNAAQSKFGGAIPVFGESLLGDAFVAKLDPSGANLLHSTYWGGTQADIADGIAVDSSGNAYVTGGTQSPDFPVSTGAYQTRYAGGSPVTTPDPYGDAFITKFDPNGARVWSTLLGGSGDDWAAAIALDAAGNVYVAGSSESSDFPQTANALPACRSLGRPFVTELDPTGSQLVASTGLPGLGYDTTTSLAVNGTGVYIAGYARSQAFFAFGVASQKSYSGGASDGFVAKLNLAASSPGLFPACVLNAASLLAGNEANVFNGAVAPGEIVSLFGVGLGPTPAASTQLTSSGTVATTLGDTQILFDGIPAPLLYAGANQVNAVVPYGIKSTGTTMTLSTVAGQSDSLLLPVAPAVPAIFSASETGQGQALVLNQDYTVNSASNPAPRGSYIMIFAEGAGLLMPAMADGAIAPSTLPLPAPALQVTATIRGVTVPVQFVGAAPGFVSGALQVNVQVPTSIDSGNSAALFLNVGGQTSQYNVTIAIK